MQIRELLGDMTTETKAIMFQSLRRLSLDLSDPVMVWKLTFPAYE